MQPGPGLQAPHAGLIDLFGIRDSYLSRSAQDQQRSMRIAFELRQPNRIPANKVQDLIRGAIACLQQDHFGRCASRKAEAGKIFVLSEKNESMRLRVFPDERIGRAAESNQLDMY
jgi:hypothetical protein